jgi:hypothetical protein
VEQVALNRHVFAATAADSFMLEQGAEVKSKSQPVRGLGARLGWKNGSWAPSMARIADQFEVEFLASISDMVWLCCPMKWVARF